jgi:hypothetical protein
MHISEHLPIHVVITSGAESSADRSAELEFADGTVTTRGGPTTVDWQRGRKCEDFVQQFLGVVNQKYKEFSPSSANTTYIPFLFVSYS